MARIVSCSQFSQFIVSQQPFFDSYVIKDIRPEASGWIAHVTSGTWEAWSGTQHTRDRFNHVYPDVTNCWNETSADSCLGTPCDKQENLIGWGSSRLNMFLEEQSWATQLLCFDQLMHITKAKEQFAYIISNILKPATVTIQSNFIRRRGAQYVDNKWIANRNFGSAAANFEFTWVKTTNASGTCVERYIDTNAPPTSVFKLTPQMLQRVIDPLTRVGYLGTNPYGDKMPPMFELVTGEQTLWELDRLGGQQGIGGIPSINGNWRFTDFAAASAYWRYGLKGTIGQFSVRVDPEGLRFNYVGVVAGKHRYQVLLPMMNIPSSGAGSAAGIKSVNNPAYDNAQYEFSYVWHTKILQILFAEAMPVNPEMPFAARNFAGKWQFVMDNLGADQNGCVIENKRRNKGQFIADFKEAVAPDHTEFGVLIFNKREPSCVIEINTCNADPGYPTQSYESSNANCVDLAAGTSPFPANVTLTFTPVLNGLSGTYQLAQNSVLCEGAPVSHPAISGSTTLAALVVQLNSLMPDMGTFAVASGTTISLTTNCNTASFPWQS